jgi:hypothetical protein
VKGEIVAAERVSPSEVEKVSRAPCGAAVWRGVLLG